MSITNGQKTEKTGVEPRFSKTSVRPLFSGILRIWRQILVCQTLTDTKEPIGYD